MNRVELEKVIFDYLVANDLMNSDTETDEVLDLEDRVQEIFDLEDHRKKHAKKLATLIINKL